MEKNNTLQYKGYHTKIEFDSEEFVNALFYREED